MFHRHCLIHLSIMLRIVSCFFIVLQVVTSQPPPQCRGPPAGIKNPGECCKIEPIFKEDDFKDCGIEKPDDAKNFKMGPPDCSKSICLLKKYNLMKDDTDLDMDAAAEFLDKWAESNKDFKDAVDKAKDKCLKDDLPGPPEICTPHKVVFCVAHTIFSECPKWEDTENCKKLKDHIEECKSYFP